MSWTLTLARGSSRGRPAKPGEHCGLCRFFQGKPGQTSGFAGCQIFAGYAVDAGGWCASFNARS